MSLLIYQFSSHLLETLSSINTSLSNLPIEKKNTFLSNFMSTRLLTGEHSYRAVR